MLCQRLRRWHSIETTVCQRLVSARGTVGLRVPQSRRQWQTAVTDHVKIYTVTTDSKQKRDVDQRRRRWANFIPALCQRVGLAVVCHDAANANRSDFLLLTLRGPPFDIQGGGGTGVFVARKLFMSTGLGGALKISIFLHVYIEQLLK